MTDTETVQNNMGERFRQIANELYDGNKSALARALEMKPGSFSKYLRGDRRPGAEILRRLHRLGVNLNWLVDGTGPMLLGSPSGVLDERSAGASSLTLGGTTVHRVSLLQVSIDERGEVRLQEMDRAEWLSEDFVDRMYGGPPDRLCRFRVSCNMMAPTIRPGDRVRAFQLEADLPIGRMEEGGVYVLCGPAGVLFTRIRETRPEDKIVLQGDNPDLSEQVIRAEQWGDDYQVVARVVEVARSL